jgi:DNA-nicking Smr family endonuclease
MAHYDNLRWPDESPISNWQSAMDDGPVRIPIEQSLDLHAFPPRDVLSVVEAYLEAAHAASFRQVRLVHGRGIGVQRAAVQRLLAGHPLVRRYWDAPESSLGATVVELVDAAGTS